jgi:hypothetical protein
MNILKHTVLLGLFWALTNVTLSQSYSITPNDTVELTGMKEDLQSLMISQLNTSSDTIRLKWQKVSEVVPSNWDATICDNAICYGNLVDSGRMTSTAPGSTSFLLLHVTAHVNYGTAVVRYSVWNPAAGTHRDTLTFIVNVTATSGISANISNPDFKVYPNPVISNFLITSTLETGFTFKITDMLGTEVQSGNTMSKSSVVSSDGLSNGLYVITLLDGNNILSTHKIIKE